MAAHLCSRFPPRGRRRDWRFRAASPGHFALARPAPGVAWCCRGDDRFLPRSSRSPRAEAVFYVRQDISLAGTAHSYSGPDRNFCRLLQNHRPVDSASSRLFLSSRAQFAQRLLRPVSSQPLRANLPLYLRRTCCIRRIHRYLGCSRSGFHRMDSGLARKIAGGLGQQAAFALARSCFFVPVMPGPRAEDLGAPPVAPPMSPPCDVPATDIAAPATLPNVTAALQKGEKVRILAIGSSSTLGYGASSKDMSYPAQLETILEHALKGVDVVILNRGVSGEMAEDTAERIRSEVALRNPDLVLWQLGTNDALARIPPQEFEDTVRSTIRWLKENRIDVVLVGVQYTTRLARDANYVAIRDSLQKIAAEENILYVRRYDAMRFIAQTRANLQLMAGDNFHLNDLGYQCMAEHVAHALIVSLFVKRVRPIHN